MSNSPIQPQPIRIGIDVGGTFTDVILIDAKNNQWHVKIPSIPDDPSTGVLDGLQQVLKLATLSPEEVDYVLHGSTVATNAVLQQKGARTSLIITKGFKDILEIGRQQRSTLYNLFERRILPLVPRERCFDVRERICADGSMLTRLTKKEAIHVVQKAGDQIESIAICLLFAYKNSEHEELLQHYIHQIHPHLPISLSSNILPEFREYERASTTVLDAYVAPVLQGYLRKLEVAMEKMGITAPLLIMQNHGGVLQSSATRKHSVRLIFSGLAGGALGGRYTGQLLKEPNVITFDMGGTSTDVSLISNNSIRETSEGSIGGFPCRVPMVDIETVGAGGGSIAWVDDAQILHVGPQSAGAKPGPACYGNGGLEPTVTDANLVLGRLNPHYFLGGKMPLYPQQAHKAIQTVAKNVGLTEKECAFGIIRIVNANMERTIRIVSVQRGFDPRDFALIAFGGAGPMHGWALAQNLGIPRIIIPLAPGLHSALGLLATDLRSDQSQTVLEPAIQPDLTRIVQVYQDLENSVQKLIEQQGVKSHKIQIQRQVDLRYKGQAFELTLDAPSSELTQHWLKQVVGAFHIQHNRQYGYALPEAPVMIVNLRVTAIGPMPPLGITSTSISKPEDPNPKETRQVYFEEYDDFVKTPVFERNILTPKTKIEGPAIIEQLDATTVVHPYCEASVRKGGNLILEVIE